MFGKQGSGQGEDLVPVFAVVGKVAQNLDFVKSKTGAEFHLILPGAVQDALGILKLVMIEKHLGSKQIWLIMTGKNVDGMIIIIHNLLSLA